MYPFNTAAMDIDASLLVYLVGGLSCFHLYFFSFSPLFGGLELAQIYSDKQYIGCLLRRLKEVDCLFACLFSSHLSVENTCSN